MHATDPHLPTISIVLVPSDEPARLEERLDGLAGQTWLPMELVVSGEARGDDARRVLRRFQRQAPFPVVVHPGDPARGCQENFLAAMALARGRWIAPCDHDDLWHPRKLEVCSRHASMPGVTLIAHQADRTGPDGRRTGRLHQGIAATGVKGPLAHDLWGTLRGSTMLFDRHILEVADADRRFVDDIDGRQRVAHDRWICFLARTLGRTVEIAQPLASCRAWGTDAASEGTTPGAPARPVSEISRENAACLRATRQMREIVERLPAGIEAHFPCFDRAHALRVFERAERQLDGRQRIYDSGSARAVLWCVAMMLRGDYRNAQDRSVRWRSFAKDLRISLAGA